MDSVSPENSESDVLQRGEPVFVIDRVVVRPGCQRQVIALFKDEYASYAASRNLHFVDLFALPPFERPHNPSELLVIWRYPTLDDVWVARAGEDTDERLTAFWESMSTLIVSRTRDLGRQALMEGVNLPSGIDVSPPPAHGPRHQILFVKPTELLSPRTQAQWIQAAESLAGSHGILVSRAGFHGDFSYLEGCFTWDIVSDGEAAPTEQMLLRALPGPAVASEFVELGEALDGGFRDRDLSEGLKRTIFFRVGDNLCDDQIKELHESLRSFAGHVPEIRNWIVSRVAASKGPIRWTHCYEQEFTDLADITGPYLHHPFHWSVIDRLFHRESPTQVVHEFTHTIQPIGASVLASIYGPKG